MSTILRTIFGSHMYGLNTPSSDKDYKEVFIPEFKSLILHGPLQHTVHSTASDSQKNTKDDIDTERIALAKFVRLAAKGEMICIDLLHGAPCNWEQFTVEWKMLHNNRHLFYTKDMRAYLGYIRKQVTKYGVKGERLAALEKAINYLSQFDKDLKLKEVMDHAPTPLPLDDQYLFTREAPGANGVTMRFYEVCGRQHQETVRLWNVLESMKSLHKEYGHRAHSAKDSDGVDWKAVSHGFRAGYQLTQLYERGMFEYPLPETQFILDVKQGKLPFEELQPKLEEVFERVNELAPKSGFPDKTDPAQLENLLLNIYLLHFGEKTFRQLLVG